MVGGRGRGCRRGGGGVLRRGGRGEGLMFGGPLNVLAGGKGGRKKGVLSYYDLEMISFYLDEFGTGSFGAPPGPIRPYPSYFLPANCTQAWQGKIELTPLSTGIARPPSTSFLPLYFLLLTSTQHLLHNPHHLRSPKPVHQLPYILALLDALLPDCASNVDYRDVEFLFSQSA